MTDTTRMKIGIFVNSLAPVGQSQVRFQRTLFDGLRKLTSDKYHFEVFSYYVGAEHKDTEGFSFHEIEREPNFARFAHALRARVAKQLIRICQILGIYGKDGSRVLSNWNKIYEP